MPEAKCRICGGTIYWLKSQAGKIYACNSEDRRDFHSSTCTGPPTPPAQATAVVSNPRPGVPTKTLEERTTWLESEIREMLIRLDRLEADNESVSF